MTAADLVYRDFEPADAASVTELWQECGLTRPWNDPVKDIERKLTDRNGAFWVVCRGSALIASVMIGYDGHRGTINYFAIAPVFQRSGVGAELMHRAEAFLVDIGARRPASVSVKTITPCCPSMTGLAMPSTKFTFVARG